MTSPAPRTAASSTTAPGAEPSSLSASRADSALHLRADGISHRYGARRVLTDVSLTVPAGTPTGLLGENGSGKSTLLRILAGAEEPESGEVQAPGPVGLLHQELPHDPSTTTLAQVVEEALTHARRLEESLTEAGAELAVDDSPRAAARYDALLARATLADVWNAETRAAEVLAGLGLADVPSGRLLAEISGGQRGRLALAHLLITRPTTLLLDEPTNHLDDAGARFLAGLLADHPGPVLVASHDRAFLDEATHAQLDLDPSPTPLGEEVGGLTAYTGTFTDYLHARLDARERWERRFRDEQEELDRLRESVKAGHSVGHEGRAPRTEAKAAKKFYADRHASVVSRRVRDAERRLAELEESQIRKPPAELHFTGMPRGDRRRTAGEVLVSVADAGLARRLAPTSLSVSAGEKLLITGPNGSGKSTLLSLLAGLLDPDRGTVSVTRDRALLAQDEEIDERSSVRRMLGGSPEDESVPDLMGLVHPRDLDRPLGELSRGQQRRAALAALLTSPPSLLLLDEPTNHLSLDLATRLERAIGQWEGTVVIASHDRWLRRRWTGRVLELDGPGVTPRSRS
ncbi:ABC-F family ATP-binding cassette domain-containing protein [Brachybacterium kimchii]|uniref:ATP-binding cassette domain-containing protein n=1 Tax=Brachybacterium kimchii TaxID=2942909 RepID=A0ABY4NAG9_9MICO|nr:ATP-binding cassette domain-containing protein [Brachybacterium kimchii]UQN31559.1 ATP-binding cassette domain-containing protein [Brachybacterium kimchii]